MTFEFLTQYNKAWGDFSLNGNLGANLYKRRYNCLTQTTVGGLFAPGFFDIEASKDRPTNISYLLTKEIRSMYGMLSLGYKETYFIKDSRNYLLLFHASVLEHEEHEETRRTRRDFTLSSCS